MAKKDSHPEVAFRVWAKDGTEQLYKTLDEAAAAVFRVALESGVWNNLTAILYSEAGARWWGSEEAIRRFRKEGAKRAEQIIRVKVTPDPEIWS